MQNDTNLQIGSQVKAVRGKRVIAKGELLEIYTTQSNDTYARIDEGRVGKFGVKEISIVPVEDVVPA